MHHEHSGHLGRGTWRALAGSSPKRGLWDPAPELPLSLGTDSRADAHSFRSDAARATQSHPFRGRQKNSAGMSRRPVGRKTAPIFETAGSSDVKRPTLAE